MKGEAFAARAEGWRALLGALREKIRIADRRRRWANAHAVVAARRSRRALRDRLKAYRAHERARIKREADGMRDHSRRLLAARKAHIRSLGLSAVRRARAELAAKRDEKRAAARTHKWEARALRMFDRRMSKIEKRRHSDDEVRANLDPELVPVFERVKRHIKGNPRLSRTEQFTHWVEENRGEVFAMQDAAAHKAMGQLLREEARLSKRARPASARRQAQTRALLAEVPF